MPDRAQTDQASSHAYVYLTTVTPYNIVSSLGNPSRLVSCKIAGDVTVTRLNGTTVGPFAMLAGESLPIQAKSITLGTGTAALVLV